MVDRETADRQALGILSDTVSEELGPTSKVAKEVRRAYTSGRQIDRFMARAAFDSLPGWQRSSIGTKANARAHHAVDGGDEQRAPGSTERDWRDLGARTERRWSPSSGTAGSAEAGGRARVQTQRPPSFLTRDD
jgi:hypothetical protein